MKIHKKLLISFFVLVLLASSGGVYSYLILSKASRYVSGKEIVYDILVRLEESRNIEKNFLIVGRRKEDFLEDGKSTLTHLHYSLLDSVKILCEELKYHEVIKDNNLKPEVYKILDVVSLYEQNFIDLKQLLFERGFKDHGLEGSMRDNVHELQQCISAEEKVFAFSMRRHEKDFMLRKDLKYFDKLRETVDEFVDFINKSSMPHMTWEYKSKVISTTNDYLKKFENLVLIEELIGLNETEGLQGKLNASASSIKPAVYSLLTQVEEENSKLQGIAGMILIISILVPLVAGFIISLILTRKIAHPISSLNRIIKNIIRGKKDELKKLEEIKSRDEIGELAKNFNQMMSTINGHLDEISEKNLRLEQAAKDEQKRKWIAEELSDVTDLMKNYAGNLEDFSYQIISKLVKAVNANQGGIFFIDNIENPAKMIQFGSHAYDRKKFVTKEILKGEGIIGAVWLEKEYSLLTDIPKEYVSITSGIGDATPTSLLVIPVIHDDFVLGVVEIASFERFDAFQIEFLEKASERIASMYFTITTQEKKRILLEQTQLQTEKMKAQEEELRQNMEELQATQEQMTKEKIETESSKKLLASIVDLIPFPVFVKDNEFRYTIVNRAEASIYNTTAETMLGKDDSHFVKDARELNTIRNSDSIVIDSNQKLTLPVQTISFPNGTTRMLQTVKIPFFNPITGTANILGVSIDIDEKKKTQHEENVMRGKLRETNKMINSL